MSREQSIRELVNFLCVADETMHRGSGRRWGRRLPLSLSGPLADELCLAADVTYGWGPGAEDWDRRKTPFIEAVHALLRGAT